MKKLCALLGYDEIEVHDGHVTFSEVDILTIEENLPLAKKTVEEDLDSSIQLKELLEATEDEGNIIVPLSNIYELELKEDWTEQVFGTDFLRPENNCIVFTQKQFILFSKIHS